MTVIVEESKKMAESSRRENVILPHEYGCEVLLEKTTLERANDASFPNDAYLIWYVADDKQYIDLVRCHKKVNLFDMYYDKYGPKSIERIDFGYGRICPKRWGYKAPEVKKKRK
jgi:hypothetical protein